MVNADTMIPFFGKVEDVNDPLKNGRVRVRVFGYNPENKGILPTESLKWFSVVLNNTETLSGVGISPTGYSVGSMVFGYYIDSDRQYGIVIGSIPGIVDEVNDVSVIARGDEEGGDHIAALKEDVRKDVETASGETWSEPETPYGTVYPNNKTMTTKSGHVIEIDDTEGAERIKIFHKSGTFKEIHVDGSQVTKIVNHNYTLISADDHIAVEGNCKLYIGGDSDVRVKGNSTHDIEGDTIIRAPSIQLGEDGKVEPSVLGNKLANWIESELVPWLNSHKHLSASPGSPSSAASAAPTGPFDPGSGKQGGAVYSKVNTNQ